MEDMESRQRLFVFGWAFIDTLSLWCYAWLRQHPGGTDANSIRSAGGVEGGGSAVGGEGT